MRNLRFRTRERKKETARAPIWRSPKQPGRISFYILSPVATQVLTCSPSHALATFSSHIFDFIFSFHFPFSSRILNPFFEMDPPIFKGAPFYWPGIRFCTPSKKSDFCLVFERKLGIFLIFLLTFYNFCDII